MARSIWKGSIRFGLVNVPVALHTAEEADELSFTLLDRRDLSPVGYQRVNKSSGEEVPWDEIVKGYEYEDGRYVVLGDEDFLQANVEATRTIDIVAFVDAAAIDPVYFDRPYYLAPTAQGEKGYALLRETLERTGRAGIATVVIRTRQHLAALLPRGKALVLVLLRFAHELRGTKGLDLPDAKVSDKELAMAEKLVEGMVEEWDPEAYHDEYRDDLLALIERKVEAGETETVAEPIADDGAAEPQVIDIMSLLKKSVREVEGKGGKKQAKKKAAGKKAPGRDAPKKKKRA